MARAGRHGLEGLLLAVTDANQTVAGVVADQDRAVRHLEHVDRAPDGGGASASSTRRARGDAGQEAIHERLLARPLPAVRMRHHDAIADRRGPVPRAVLRDDGGVLVAGWK